MKRYRIVQTHFPKEPQTHLHFNFKDNSGYHNFPHQDLHINGWVFSKVGSVNSLKIYLFSGGKKLFKEVTEFLTSPSLKKKFPNYPSHKARIEITISYQDIAPLLSGNDFSLHIIANVGDEEQTIGVLCFVEDDDVSQPIFVIGSPRSGTSILGLALREALEYESFAESHLAPLLCNFLPNVEEYFTQSLAAQMKGMMLSQIDSYLVKAQLQNVIKNYYKEFFGPKGFIDKTPGVPMLNAIEYVREMWPQAKFVFAKRRGIENVSSRLKKFPNTSFKKHCQQWSQTLESWYSLKNILPREIYLEVDQYDIQMRPNAVTTTIIDFLHLTSKQATTLQKVFTIKEPEKTRENVKEKAKSISNVGWNKKQIKIFRFVCNNTMSKFGYSKNEQYYSRK